MASLFKKGVMSQVMAEAVRRPALGVLHLVEGGFDLPRFGNQPVLGRVPDVDDEIDCESIRPAKNPKFRPACTPWCQQF